MASTRTDIRVYTTRAKLTEVVINRYDYLTSQDSETTRGLQPFDEVTELDLLVSPKKPKKLTGTSDPARKFGSRHLRRMGHLTARTQLAVSLL